MLEMMPGGDPGLDEDLAQMPVDRARAEEQPAPDLGIRETFADRPARCGLPDRSAPGACLGSALSDRLTECLQADGGAFGEGRHTPSP